jgi:uncharacterized protein YjcR
MAKLVSNKVTLELSTIIKDFDDVTTAEKMLELTNEQKLTLIQTLEAIISNNSVIVEIA